MRLREVQGRLHPGPAVGMAEMFDSKPTSGEVSRMVLTIETSMKRPGGMTVRHPHRASLRPALRYPNAIEPDFAARG